MLELTCAPEGIEEREQREVEAGGGDTESLLYAWLAEILALADAEHFVARRVEITRLSTSRVRGLLCGEPYDKLRHHLGTYIKAVTLHQFSVTKTNEGWKAAVFLDV
jgi:SHS2 domain-containing protein